MPSKNRIFRKITDREILRLLDMEIIAVCTETGVVRGKKGGVLIPCRMGRNHRLGVKISHNGGLRKIALAKLVWMAHYRRLVPAGFDIHHEDENPENPSHTNLVCVFGMDHPKLHGKRAEVPIPE